MVEVIIFSLRKHAGLVVSELVNWGGGGVDLRFTRYPSFQTCRFPRSRWSTEVRTVRQIGDGNTLKDRKSEAGERAFNYLSIGIQTCFERRTTRQSILHGLSLVHRNG